MKLKLAIIMMAASVILAMTLAAASSVEGSFIEEPENESIEKIVQVASEVSDLEAPNGCYLVNASIVGNYYVAYYSTDDGSSARSNHIDLGRPLPQWTEYYVLVHRLGSNETIIYDPRVWVLSNEYGKG